MILLLPAFWRVYSIAANWNHAQNTAASRRRLVLSEFWLGLIDIPTALAGGLVLLTVYRWRSLRDEVARTPGFFAPFQNDGHFCSQTLQAHSWYRPAPSPSPLLPPVVLQLIACFGCGAVCGWSW